MFSCLAIQLNRRFTIYTVVVFSYFFLILYALYFEKCLGQQELFVCLTFHAFCDINDIIYDVSIRHVFFVVVALGGNHRRCKVLMQGDFVTQGDSS